MQQSALGGLSSDPEKRSLVSRPPGRCTTKRWSCRSTAMPPIGPIAQFSGNGFGNVGSYSKIGTCTPCACETMSSPAADQNATTTHDDCPNDSSPIHTPPLC